MAIRLVFMSSPAFGIPTLRLLNQDRRFQLLGVVTQPDKPVGRGLRLTPSPIKRAAQELGLPVIQHKSLRTPEAFHEIAALRPDLIAVAAYGQWIPDNIFNLPPLRSVNLHPSLLPRHRGAAPVISAILAGETSIGLSVLFVEDEMDSGDLLGQMSIPLHADDTTTVVMERLAEIGAPFFVEALAGWAQGKIAPVRQDHTLSTWIDRLKKDAGRIDWSQPAEAIDRRCRALTPWPGTFTFLYGQRLLIHKATPFPFMPGFQAEPGVVWTAGPDIMVAAGQGALRLDIVQLAGRRPLPAADFARGQRAFIGAQLGQPGAPQTAGNIAPTAPMRGS